MDCCYSVLLANFDIETITVFSLIVKLLPVLETFLLLTSSAKKKLLQVNLLTVPWISTLKKNVLMKVHCNAAELNIVDSVLIPWELLVKFCN